MVTTRFPPEPNGVLHVGHAKALLVNFGTAAKAGGRCILRFDDTNPEVETAEHVGGITDVVQWLGFEPVAVTHTSDYFRELYELALDLIRRGKAYVCHQSSAEIAASRRSGTPSPWRVRPVAESLALFEAMRKGDLQGATLRMLTPDNEDMVAYRVKHEPHFRTGTEWKVYPSYDFSHCIVDSLEGITHSLCTKEFECRRPAYYWLLEALELPHRPVVQEFGKLRVSGATLSKRKIRELIESGAVGGWDDPRLLTLSGLRRRGVPPAAVLAFCESTGVSRADAVVHVSRLDHFVHKALDATAPRTMGAIDPITLVIEDLGEPEDVDCSVFPGRTDKVYSARLTRDAFLSREDFALEPAAGYRGLTPGGAVRLRYAGIGIRHTGHTVGPDGRVSEVRCARDSSNGKQGVITWVGSDSVECIAALFDGLRRTETPCRLHPTGVDLARTGVTFQMERVGYFCMDPVCSTPEALVLNMTTALSRKRR